MTWILNDDFITDRAAGSVNGTAAEPGPGTRTVTDTNSKLSITGGKLSAATGGVGDQNPRYELNAQTRVPGRMLIADITPTGRTNVGWGNYVVAIRFAGDNTLTLYDGVATVYTVASFTPGTNYKVAVILRTSGTFYFIKGGAFTNWSLFYIKDGCTTTNLAPRIESGGTTDVWTSDFLRVPTSLWLPTPLASDGFGSAFGTTDGLGHAEGVAGGLGAGGGGLICTQQVGTFQTAAGVAQAATLVGGKAIATIDSGKADIWFSCKLVRSAGNVGVIVRWVDADNYVYAYHDGTSVILRKVTTAGGDVLVASVAKAYSASARFIIDASGTAFRVYYNEALIGSSNAISDAVLQTSGKIGLYTTDLANTFNDFAGYAKGTAGEYIMPEDVTVYPSAIDSAEAWGSPTLIPGAVTIQPGGIASVEAWGIPAVLPGPVAVYPESILSAEGFGLAVILPGPVTLLPAGIMSGEAFGQPLVAPGVVTILPAGIFSEESFGKPLLVPGPVIIAPLSIESLEAFGVPGVYRIPKRILVALEASRLEVSVNG